MDSKCMLDNFNMIYTNTFPLPLITNILLPKIKERETKGMKGAVINISSISARGTNIGGLSVYSATKAFDLRFSQVLEKELKSEKIDVHCVTPGSVNTNMNKNPQGIFAVDSAAEFSRHSLAQVGHTAEACGHWKHHMFIHYNAWWPTEKIIEYLNARKRIAYIEKKIKDGEELTKNENMFYSFAKETINKK
jgi:short-subunit dehydrogenase